VRFLFLCAAIFAPIVVVVLAPWIPKYDRTQELYVLNAAIIVSLLAAMVWYFPSRDYYSHSVQESFPVMAVQYLNTHSVPGPMYNSYYFGGYLIFARGPEHKVFIDGRGDVYERAGVFSDQVALVNLKPGFLAILQKYNIQSCLLSPGDGLSTTLAALPEWQQAYTDDQSVIFVRRPSEVSEERDVRATQMEHAASRPL
jgi:hypothetical protein